MSLIPVPPQGAIVFAQARPIDPEAGKMASDQSGRPGDLDKTVMAAVQRYQMVLKKMANPSAGDSTGTCGPSRDRLPC